MRRFAAVAACLVAFAALPAVAVAGGRNTPPGNSSVDEYSETIPGPTGDHPVPLRGPVFPGGGSPLAVGGSRGERALLALGRDGRAVEQLAKHTGPRRALAGRGGGLPDSGGRSLPEQILDALGGSGDGGMGLVLPLLLLAAAVGTVAVARRRRHESTI